MDEPRRKRILVVEDEPLVAMLLEDMLIELGFEVVGPALRLDAATELAGREPLDGAILDVNLGEARSDAVAAALAERGIPFAFATGYAAPGGAWGERVPVLRKPFRQDAVGAVVETLLAAASASGTKC